MRYALLLSLLLAPAAAAQHPGQHPGHAASPYVDEAGRAVKALSPQEVDDLLAGRGMGLARAAELNGYPGPKHVLELADSLALSPDQRAEAERLRAEVETEAQDLGAQVVEMERRLDALFAGGAATPEAVDRMTTHLGALRGRLRAVHLRAHVAMRAALTPEQATAYARLRGYTD